MSRLCERPGCSENGDVAYGMVPEDLLFWIAPLGATPPPNSNPNLLCRRHANAMVVPRGWTLDDLREDVPRLFAPAAGDPADAASRTRPRRSRSETSAEQLTLDGTGEIDRPAETEPPEPWQPEFDTGDDLDGLLEVTSPLLARAFRGTDRPTGSSG